MRAVWRLVNSTAFWPQDCPRCCRRSTPADEYPAGDRRGAIADGYSATRAIIGGRLRRSHRGLPAASQRLYRLAAGAAGDPLQRRRPVYDRHRPAGCRLRGIIRRRCRSLRRVAGSCARRSSVRDVILAATAWRTRRWLASAPSISGATRRIFTLRLYLARANS